MHTCRSLMNVHTNVQLFISWVICIQWKKLEIFWSFLHGETEVFISPCLHPTSMFSCCGLDRAWTRGDVRVGSCSCFSLCNLVKMVSVLLQAAQTVLVIKSACLSSQKNPALRKEWTFQVQQPFTWTFLFNLRTFVVTHIVYYDNIKLSLTPGKKL